ncbi:MAG: MucR family transcriptional regulator [Xanthobacteraceae bacterium]
MMRAKPPAAFKTRRDIARYFRGNTIECLICGRCFKRLHTHLGAKHGMAADDYKKRFGLPWTRGLTSATSLANSGWTDERKAKARKLAQKSRFFDMAHSTPRRELAPFLKTEAVEHLGVKAKAFGEKFDAQVRALAQKGLRIRAIARVLKVAHTTVLDRVKRSRKGSRNGEGARLLTQCEVLSRPA